MYGIRYQLNVYMLVVLICSRTEWTNISQRRVALRTGTGYTYNSRHSIRELLPFLLPYEVFLGWQSC